MDRLHRLSTGVSKREIPDMTTRSVFCNPFLDGIKQGEKIRLGFDKIVMFFDGVLNDIRGEKKPSFSSRIE